MRFDKSKTSMCLFGALALAASFLTGSVSVAADQSHASAANLAKPVAATGGTLVPKRVRLIIGFQQTYPA